MSQERMLSQANFDRLLAWLHADRNQAGIRYEAIRQRLIKIFTCRGCAEAEDLADETINRVTLKIEGLSHNYVGDPALYFYGVAKKLLLEHSRRMSRPMGEHVCFTPVATNDVEPEYECLQRCMDKLSLEQRELVLQYYAEDKDTKIKRRKEIAGRMGIAMNALRIRAHRIRVSLHQCVEECLKRPNAC